MTDDLNKNPITDALDFLQAHTAAARHAADDLVEAFRAHPEARAEFLEVVADRIIEQVGEPGWRAHLDGITKREVAEDILIAAAEREESSPSDARVLQFIGEEVANLGGRARFERVAEIYRKAIEDRFVEIGAEGSGGDLLLEAWNARLDAIESELGGAPAEEPAP